MRRSVCAACGAPMKRADRFCTVCGADRHPQPRRETLKPEVKPDTRVVDFRKLDLDDDQQKP